MSQLAARAAPGLRSAAGRRHPDIGRRLQRFCPEPTQSSGLQPDGCAPASRRLADRSSPDRRTSLESASARPQRTSRRGRPTANTTRSPRVPLRSRLAGVQQVPACESTFGPTPVGCEWHTEVPNFACWFGNSDRNRFSMDIETNKSYFNRRPAPFRCGSVLLTQLNPRIRDSSQPFHGH